MELERMLFQRADAHPLEQPVLELHNITWRLGGYADVVDGVRLALSDVLGYARGMNLKVRLEDETPLGGGPFEGAYVVRVGEERERARFFLILPDAIPPLGGYMPDEDHDQLRMRHEGAVRELRAVTRDE